MSDNILIVDDSFVPLGVSFTFVGKKLQDYRPTQRTVTITITMNTYDLEIKPYPQETRELSFEDAQSLEDYLYNQGWVKKYPEWGSEDNYIQHYAYIAPDFDNRIDLAVKRDSAIREAEWEAEWEAMNPKDDPT